MPTPKDAPYKLRQRSFLQHRVDAAIAWFRNLFRRQKKEREQQIAATRAAIPAAGGAFGLDMTARQKQGKRKSQGRRRGRGRR